MNHELSHPTPSTDTPPSGWDSLGRYHGNKMDIHHEMDGHHGEEQLSPEVQRALGEALSEIQEFHAEQLKRYFDFIDKQALRLAKLQFPEDMTRLQAIRRNPHMSDEAKENARQQVQEMVASMRDLIKDALRMGGGAESPLRQAKETLDSKLSDVGVNRRDAEAVLQVAGILYIDEQSGEKSYYYPDGLVPKETTEKLDAYIASIAAHTSAAEALRNADDNDDKKAARNSLVQSDLARRSAHNTVARDFAAVLDLQHPDGTEYGTEDYRGLVTEMVRVYKGGEPYEKATTITGGAV